VPTNAHPGIGVSVAGSRPQAVRGPVIAGDSRLAHELIGANARSFADAPAVLCGQTWMTFGDLWRAAEAVAAALARLGVAVNEPVGLAVRRDPRLLPAIVGIWLAGGCYVPLDQTMPKLRTQHIIDETRRYGLSWILADDAALAELAVPGRVSVPVGSYAPLTVGRVPEPDQRDRADPGLSGRPAYVMYTSGSTGQPKGIVVSHANLVAFTQAIEAAIGGARDETVVATTPLTFDISVLELIWPLAMGRRIVLLDSLPDTDPARLAAVLRSTGPVLLQLTPSTVDLVELPDPPNSVRVLVGGEALPGSTAATLRRKCHRVFNMYGPTEATVWFTYHEVGAGDESAGTVRLGRPLANCGALILDREGRAVAPGVVGELHLCGPQIATGYLGRPDATRAAFRTDVLDGETVYRTGDLAQWLPDGTIDFAGRIDDQVKIAGNRVELGDVEANLREHPSVRAAAAVLDQTVAPPVLRAYVQLSDVNGGDDPGGHATALLLDWMRVFEHEFADRSSGGELAPDFRLWRSFLDGAPISRSDMLEWLAASARLVANAGARRILDVGCGMGDLLYALGDTLDSYVGVEPTPEAVAGLRTAFTHRADRAAFIRGLAHELGSRAFVAAVRSEIARHAGVSRPDSVVINSVVQYFPSMAYLTDVLDHALDLVADGGAVVIADVRSLPLLPRLLATTGIRPDRLAAGRRLASTIELCLDPHYFVDWCDRWPGQVACWVSPKLMAASNEVADFRFDVVLRKTADSTVEYRSSQYSLLGGSAAAIQQWMAAAISDGRPAALRGIPNARLEQSKPSSTDGGRAAVAMAPIELNRAIAGRPGFAVGLDPADPAAGTLLMAYHPDGRNDWTAIARPYGRPPELGTRPWRAVAEEAIGAELASFLAGRLPSPMLPATIRIVEKLPLNHNGKLDRTALARLSSVSAEVRVGAGGDADSTAVPDESPVQLVTGLLSTLLSTEVGADDDIVDLGASSLHVARLAGILWSQWGWTITAGQALRARTARSISALAPAGPVEAGLDVDATGTVRPPVVSLSLAQRALLVLTYQDAESNERMNVIMGWQMDGRIDIDRINRALDRVTVRHRLLRATISPSGATSVLPESTVSLQVLGAPDEPSGEDIMTGDLIRAAFDLATAPPVRWVLRWVRPDRAEMTLVAHHICVDDAALRTLFADFVSAYRDEPLGSDAGQEDRLGQALAVERRLQRERSREDRAYWAGQRTALASCVGYRREERASTLCWRSASLVPGGGPTLAAHARAARVTPFCLFLAIAGWAFGRALDARDVLAGVPVSTRETVGADGELGCFANLVPIGLGVDPDDVARYVARTSEALVTAVDHSALPFAEIARLAGLPRDRWNNVSFGFVCELEPVPAAVSAADVTFIPSFPAPVRQVYPVNLRGELVGEDLAINLDVESSMVEHAAADQVVAWIASAVQDASWAVG
jgi:amino acid adenylation domain-containing protein